MKTKVMIISLIGILITVFAGLGIAEVTPGTPESAKTVFCPGMEIFKILIRLNLSNPQKKEIAGILHSKKEEFKSLSVPLIRQRMELIENIHSQEWEEKQFRESFRKTARIQEDVAVFRAKIIREIKSVLSPRQVDLLENTRKNMFAGIGNLVKNKEEILKVWIETWLES